MRIRSAFTLVELLIVIVVLALLATIAVPSFSNLVNMAETVKCLSNIRNMEMAHLSYTSNNGGWMIKAGLSHGGVHGDEEAAWINTLQPYYESPLVACCPADDSPHWLPDGSPVPQSGGRYRRSSYGINEFTDPDLCPWGPPYKKILSVPNPTATVHFLEMAETGDFAGADHPHVDLWVGNVLAKASRHLQINQHGGELRTWNAKANYGFLDGHAETRTFGEVFKNRTLNNFDPAVAK